MMECIRPWAKEHRYKFRLEESYRAETDSAERGDGRWYVEILCRRGLIYPWGEDDLLAFTQVRGILGDLLALDPQVKVHQRGHGEAVVRFPSRLLDRVAAVLVPRTKRRGLPLTPERLATLRAALQGRKAPLQVIQNVPGSTQRSRDGSEGGDGL